MTTPICYVDQRLWALAIFRLFPSITRYQAVFRVSQYPSQYRLPQFPHFPLFLHGQKYFCESPCGGITRAANPYIFRFCGLFFCMILLHSGGYCVAFCVAFLIWIQVARPMKHRCSCDPNTTLSSLADNAWKRPEANCLSTDTPYSDRLGPSNLSLAKHATSSKSSAKE